MHPKLILFLKGVCMGVADVIPGVSGGTLALILGIYQDFIESIRSINPSPLLPLLRYLTSGFKPERKAELQSALGTIRLGFLIPLVCGIAVAIGAGSAVIPALMERFPELMRGLFFGLILASVWMPLRMMERKSTAALALAALLGVGAAASGYALTDPNLLVDTTSEWVEVTVPAQADEPTTLNDAIRRGPSSLTAEQIYWAEPNGALRQAVAQADPQVAQELEQQHQRATGALPTDKHALKARSLPYNDLPVPPGTTLQVPRPSLGFIFIAGAIAICAMVLPGVSGSFLLLVMGCYYFILNALKGSAKQLVHGELPVDGLLYITCFISGIAVGILSFTRLLSFLLRRFPTQTMGVLVGLMIGCLRGIWPFQVTLDGKLANVLPQHFGAIEIGAIGAALGGVAIVAILTRVGDRLEPKTTEDAL
jgi:putative membrane protein